MKIFPFILLIYAYRLRCKYFHGEVPTILVAAYNDFEIGSLRVVNYFLTEYLRENIPRMFRDDFLSEEDISRGNEAKEKLLNKSRKS